MMYSPGPMEDRGETPDLEVLEEKVGELERLTDALGSVPDEELVEVLNEAVDLLREPEMATLRGDPRLDAVRKKLGLP